MDQYQVTFTKNDYVVAVLFNTSRNAREAVDSAKLHVVGNYDKVRAVLTSDCDEE
jgi:hypothetical protein